MIGLLFEWNWKKIRLDYHKMKKKKMFLICWLDLILDKDKDKDWIRIQDRLNRFRANIMNNSKLLKRFVIEINEEAMTKTILNERTSESRLIWFIRKRSSEAA